MPNICRKNGHDLRNLWIHVHLIKTATSIEAIARFRNCY